MIVLVVAVLLVLVAAVLLVLMATVLLVLVVAVLLVLVVLFLLVSGVVVLLALVMAVSCLFLGQQNRGIGLHQNSLMKEAFRGKEGLTRPNT